MFYVLYVFHIVYNKVWHYTIIYFNKVYIWYDRPENNGIHQGRKPPLRVDKSFRLPKMKSVTVLYYHFQTVDSESLLSLLNLKLYC